MWTTLITQHFTSRTASVYHFNNATLYQLDCEWAPLIQVYMYVPLQMCSTLAVGLCVITIMQQQNILWVCVLHCQTFPCRASVWPPAAGLLVASPFSAEPLPESWPSSLLMLPCWTTSSVCITNILILLVWFQWLVYEGQWLNKRSIQSTTSSRKKTSTKFSICSNFCLWVFSIWKVLDITSKVSVFPMFLFFNTGREISYRIFRCFYNLQLQISHADL